MLKTSDRFIGFVSNCFARGPDQQSFPFSPTNTTWTTSFSFTWLSPSSIHSSRRQISNSNSCPIHISAFLSGSSSFHIRFQYLRENLPSVPYHKRKVSLRPSQMKYSQDLANRSLSFLDFFLCSRLSVKCLWSWYDQLCSRLSFSFLFG